ncbi:enoyl-CoA hydratase/isomerase family protein [Nocardioides pantholopis]|uniref:enoyl-CoA hydratase/isomerase family protein n=1 Tax=Nocardioides pantholopis TaxID=2483798 RepID=UPI0013DDC0E5|nr:enoyl-CoA hydratase-related protein [Nocardioides pantholopis]
MSGLEVARADGVVTVVLDGSRGNALGQARYAGIRAAAESVAAGEVLVLRAEGRHFCAGQDLEEHAAAVAAGTVRATVQQGAATVLALLRCRGAVVVAAQGAAVGAGALLAASADVLVLSDNAWLALPELELGLPLGAAVAARILPEPQVRRMMLTGARASAEEIARAGAATVVSRAGLADAARAGAAALRRLDPTALGLARAGWGDGERERAARRYEAELADTLRCLPD